MVTNHKKKSRNWNREGSDEPKSTQREMVGMNTDREEKTETWASVNVSSDSLDMFYKNPWNDFQMKSVPW